jgi:hypothetical protein
LAHVLVGEPAAAAPGMRRPAPLTIEILALTAPDGVLNQGRTPAGMSARVDAASREIGANVNR